MRHIIHDIVWLLVQPHNGGVTRYLFLIIASWPSLTIQHLFNRISSVGRKPVDKGKKETLKSLYLLFKNLFSVQLLTRSLDCQNQAVNSDTLFVRLIYFTRDVPYTASLNTTVTYIIEKLNTNVKLVMTNHLDQLQIFLVNYPWQRYDTGTLALDCTFLCSSYQMFGN